MSFLDPTRAVKELNVSGAVKIADLGCGSGGWSIPLAKENEDGMIYAVDVLNEPLSALKSKAETERIYNIRTVLADIEKGTNLTSNFFDAVIISNILFQVDSKEAIIKEGHRILKQTGKMLVVDWSNKDVSEEEINNKIQESGFKLIKKIDAGVSHFGYLYEKI
jgi:ubiquinone/menaquinone biosynthesis C-methylase UbiE